MSKDKTTPEIQRAEIQAAHAEMNAAHAGLGDLVDRAEAAGIPLKKILAFVIRNGVPDLITWLQSLLAAQGPASVPPA